MKKIYPAVFKEDEDGYYVSFPDLDGCLSSGKTILEAYENSKEALRVFLDTTNDLYHREINEPSKIESLLSSNKIVMLIESN